MDFAYDQIQGETIAAERASTPTVKSTGAGAEGKTNATSSTGHDLNTELQDTLHAFQASPWGAKLGGLWDNVRKQGESYYAEARKEVGEASEDAIKGLTDIRASIVKQTKGLGLGDDQKDSTTETTEANEGARSQSELDRKNDDLISRFKSEAAKRLKDIGEAEDAADEALLRFGTNIRNFLREAVSIAAPADEDERQGGAVLFESKDASGKRVIHTTRFDAQLHVIHSSLDSFLRDPVSHEWPSFKETFNVDNKTDEISRDLDKYPDLRRAMEQLVPEKVEYADFWCRYYFLRLVIETEEQKRRELLKGASNRTADDEVGWDEESDEEEAPPTPQAKKANDSSTTIQQVPASSMGAKPEGRNSNDQQSQPDSDASYDLVSGATSRAPGSPREDKAKAKKDESDEEDWE